VIFISIIWGFGLALLFKKACKDDDCVVVKVPPTFASDGSSIIYDKNNRCYKLIRYPSECVY